MNNKQKAIVMLTTFQILDSDSETEGIIKEFQCRNKKYKKRRNDRVSIEKYIENVAFRYDAEEFRKHFRLRRDTFDHLLELLAPYLVQQNVKGIGRHTHSPEMQLLVVLSMLANQIVYRLISEKYNIAKSTAWLYVSKVCCRLTELSKHYISWPSIPQARNITQKFEGRHGFPGVLGAIDGTHIPVTAPSEDQAAYCNRHQYHSLVLQAICDANYRFIDVFTGYPGSVHDARVFYNSPISRKMQEAPWELFPNTECHILGDSAYKCTTYLLTPYKDNGHLSQRQKNYNYKLSATRVCIEQSFALLKGRFRILKHVNVYNTKFIVQLIIACCVLHNICMSRNDTIDTDEQVTDNNSDYVDFRIIENDTSRIRKRNFISNLLH